MRLFEKSSQHVFVKSSQHVLNDYDTTGNVNEFLEKCKCIRSMVSLQLISRNFADANYFG